MPHLHLNPVRPTFFLQVLHRFAGTDTGTGTDCAAASGTCVLLPEGSDTSAERMVGVGSDGAREEENELEGERDFWMADLAEADWSSLRRCSL